MTAAPTMAASIAAEVKLRARSLAQDMAAHLGGPVDGVAVPRAQQAALWNLRNPQEDPAQTAALLAAGKHTEALSYVFPWRDRLIGPGSPEKRAETAERLAAQASQPLPEPPEGGPPWS